MEFEEIVKIIEKQQIVYAELPFERNQDLVRIVSEKDDDPLVVCVMDGYSDPNYIENDSEGKKAAEFVSVKFPELFLNSTIADFKERARLVANEVDRQLIEIYPEYVSCVAAFIFAFPENEIIVSVGDIGIFIWDGQWQKPDGIGDYSFDIEGFPDYMRFFGLGNYKSDPRFTAESDVVVFNPGTPILMASDGLTKALSLEDINLVTMKLKKKFASELVTSLLKEVQDRGTQSDDIAILVRNFNQS